MLSYKIPTPTPSVNRSVGQPPLVCRFYSTLQIIFIAKVISKLLVMREGLCACTEPVWLTNMKLKAIVMGDEERSY